jgi:hypothetical protein
MKKLILFIIVALLPVLLLACNEKSELEGEWKVTEVKDIPVNGAEEGTDVQTKIENVNTAISAKFVFEQDRVLTFEDGKLKGEIDSLNYTIADEGVIDIQSPKNEGNFRLNYEVNGEELILKGELVEVTLVK